MNQYTTQVCVVGGGSAGIGAAIAAARLGLDVILVEKDTLLGGTSVNSGVNNWEPVAGATGIPFEIYNKLLTIPHAVGISSMGRHCCHSQYNEPPFPGGESVIDQDLTYSDTLVRSGTKGLVDDCEVVRKQWHGVVFEPKEFDNVVRELLDETGNARIMDEKSVIKLETSKFGQVISLELDDGTHIKPEYVIDACGIVASLSKLELLTGEDSSSLFNEPSAPETPEKSFNAVSLIFRATPTKKPAIESFPSTIPEKIWWSEKFPVMCCNHYPNGDLNCNMLPTMSGAEYMRLGENKAYSECLNRVKCYWRYLQKTYPEFQKYRIWTLASTACNSTTTTPCPT